MTHVFFRFSIQLGPYFMPHHDLIDHLFMQKKIICLYRLSHLVPEILGPKGCGFFTKMY